MVFKLIHIIKKLWVIMTLIKNTFVVIHLSLKFGKLIIKIKMKQKSYIKNDFLCGLMINICKLKHQKLKYRKDNLKSTFGV